MIRAHTIDAHVEGAAVRLIDSGFPAPQGPTMVEKLEWVEAYADDLRRMVMLEPRGHADLSGVVLTEPVAPGSHAGLIFMRNSGYVALSIEGAIAAAAISLARALIVASPSNGGSHVLVLDTAAGTVRVSAAVEGLAAGVSRVSRASCIGVPSFVERGGLKVTIGSRTIRADVAYGGGFYAIVDAEVAGLPLASSHRAELRRAGVSIAAAINQTHRLAHPLEPWMRGLDGVIFTSPPGEHGAHVTTTTVFADGQIDRSPNGNSTSALLAVLDAIGWLADDTALVHEGPLGTRLVGRVHARLQIEDRSAIVPEIEGGVWITGEHALVTDEEDPLASGYRF